MTSLLVIVGLASCEKVAAKVEASIGRCCCCCCERGAGSSLVSAMYVSAVGNATLAVFNLCWQGRIHTIAAFFFFAGGYVAIGISCFSRQAKKIPGLSSLAGTRLSLLKPTVVVVAVAAVPVAALSALVAEWCAIVAISLSVLAAEFDIRRGTAILSKRPTPDHQSDDINNTSLSILREALCDLEAPTTGQQYNAPSDDDGDHAAMRPDNELS